MMQANGSVEDFFAEHDDWRGERLRQLRRVIDEAVPELSIELKWGVPVWTYNGLVCAVSAFKDHVKINFFKGAELNDTKGLFNSGLDSKGHRSINLAESDKVDEAGLQDLLSQAVSLNAKK